jgi:hypothetical protein
MADTLDLTTKDIPAAINGALLRGHSLAIAHIDEDGDPVVSFRGSVHVHGPQQLALWARKPDSGLVASLATHPRVHLIYYGGHEGPGPAFLSFKGSAHADPAANDPVYEAMVAPERDQDPERRGVAVIVDVESVSGFAGGAMFQMERTSA